MESTPKMCKQARQGDVFVEKIKSIPKTAKKQEGEVVLAYGEVTGHSHRIETGAFMWVDTDGTKYVEVYEPTALVHGPNPIPEGYDDRHGTILVDPGIYKVRQQKEFDYVKEAFRNVRD